MKRREGLLKEDKENKKEKDEREREGNIKIVLILGS